MKTADISGFGGNYEKTCQRMLTAGLKYLSDRASFDWDGYKQFRQVIGLVISENADAKALDAVMSVAAKEFGMTGAMHQAVINHLHYIATHSYTDWLAAFEARHPEDIYDLDDKERERLVMQVEGKKP